MGECEHEGDLIERSGRYYCPGCSREFLVCNPCSLAGGADRAVWHEAPACPEGTRMLSHRELELRSLKGELMKLQQEEFTKILAEVTNTVITKYNLEQPADINKGYCWIFSQAVAVKSPEAVPTWVCSLEPTSLPEENHYCHAAVLYEGRYYDSECLEGVHDHRQLPMVKRHFEKIPP